MFFVPTKKVVLGSNKATSYRPRGVLPMAGVAAKTYIGASTLQGKTNAQIDKIGDFKI
jgi:hypothetical protein